MNNLVLRHVAKRKSYKKLQRLTDKLIYAVAIISPLALLPQVYSVYATHSVGGLALSTWATFTVLNTLWVLYGVVHRQWPIIIMNALLAMLDVAIVVGICMYR